MEKVSQTMIMLRLQGVSTWLLFLAVQSIKHVLGDRIHERCFYLYLSPDSSKNKMKATTVSQRVMSDAPSSPCSSHSLRLRANLIGT